MFITKIKSEIKKAIYQIDRVDYLLLVGFLLAPMTGWRIGKVGPGEVFCLIWSVIRFRYWSNISFENMHVRFWIIFIIISTFGSVYGILFYPKESSGPRGMLTWIYLFIVAIAVVTYFEKRESHYIENILRSMCISFAIWQMFLYLYSEHVSLSFFGAPLWFGGHARYSGGGLNPHQVALPCAFTGILSVCYLINVQKITKKIIFAASAFCSVFLLLKTTSTTGTVAFYAGIFVYLLLNISQKWKVDIRLYIFLLFCIILVFLAKWDVLVTHFMEWVAEDPNGLDRLKKVKSFSDCFFKNPLFGLGPGNHAMNGRNEFHNTYLEVFAMGGGLAIIVFAIYTYRMLRLFFTNPPAEGLFVAACVFGLAGFDFRRLVYWIIMGLLSGWTIALKNEKERACKDEKRWGY